MRYGKRWSLLALLVALRAPAAQTYRLDSGNTHVSFAVEYLGIQWVSARFSAISGEFVLDESGPASRVDVIVGVASLESNPSRWNERLRSPEWLDVEQYPQMVYHSKRIELAQQGGVADGELTLHGITQPMVLNIHLLNCSSGTACEFTAQGRIRRSQFGLPHGFWSGGDQVDISITGAIHAVINRVSVSDEPASAHRSGAASGPSAR